MPLILLFFVACATFDPVTAHSPLFGAYSAQIVENQRVHLLNIDLAKYAIRPIKANRLALPTQIATENNALAVINGGFFQADGTPAGLLVIEKKVLGYQGKPRAALGWTGDYEKVLIDRLLFTASQKEFVSTTGFTTSSEWQLVDFAIGGTPLLVRDHTLIEDFSPEKVLEPFLTLKHARSAICIKDAEHWIFVAVEGSSSLELSMFGRSGFTMNELAHYMADTLQCLHAINLDGGGSTALVIDNTLVNKTTFGEREVSDVLGVFPRSFPE